VKKFRLAFLAVVIFSLLPSFVSAAPLKPGTRFNDLGFAKTWLRLDKPVQELPGVGRGYTWGPPLDFGKNVLTEIYNGLPRKVQYFDKARMELNNFAADPNDPYYVTTGLLVKELVTGYRQDGDNTFVVLKPSPTQIAGDSNVAGANQVAPIYASFAKVVTFEGAENGKPSASGSPISARIDRAGFVSSFKPPEKRLLKGYDAITQHNIADVFGAFSDQNCKVWDNKKYTVEALFNGNPTYVLGRPVTEPYWIRAVSGGVEKDVLVQLFERRVLTYTPSNPDGFKVEMGNVGEHYFYWRYVLNKQGPKPVALLSNNNKEVKIGFEGKGTVLDQTFASRILNRDVLYRVYLPPGYATSSQRYPVLYMLHGRNANYQQWTEYGLTKQADALILAKKIQPFIIVMPEGEFSYWMNHANGGPRWADYLAIDLVEHIDSTFRSLPNTTNRAIGGLSMGGHGALQVGMNYPEVFSIIGAHSPALRTKEQAFDFWGDDDYFATIDPFTLAQTFDLSSYKIWLDIGQDDKDWAARAIQFHQLLVEEGVAHTWNLWPGEHNANYWSSHTEDYLKFYSNSFAGDTAAPS